MGLSIHYRGKIAKPGFLQDLIEEVQDIAKVYGLKYKIDEIQFPEDVFAKSEYNQTIYGISFTPPECETISITFLSNGRMSTNVHLKFYGKTVIREESEYLYLISSKTQYAGIDVHRIIIKLFSHLSKKYFSDFTLRDEGEYWETNNDQLLQEKFNTYNNLIDNFVPAIQNFPIKEGESFDNYFDRLIKMIVNKREEKGI